MELLGIKFAPLNIPLKRRIETLSAAIVFSCMSYLILIGTFICIYLLFTQYWIIAISYLYWIFAVDSSTPEQGGRRIEWIRSLSIFKYARDYYPVKIHLQPGIRLNQNKNYIMGAFPHGVLAQGAFLAYTVNIPGAFQELFPSLTLYSVTLRQSFFIPIYREFLLAMGFINATAKAINHILSEPKGGSIVGIVVGGAAEAFSARAGQHRVVLKNRKGFIKIALTNGSPILPVYSFGEVDLFRQVNNPEGSILRSFQELIKKFFGFAPIIYYGRGIFQYTFGTIPFRTPINIVVGRPIDVKRTANPTREAIDELHQKFMDALNELFDEHKYKFVENPENATLLIS